MSAVAAVVVPVFGTVALGYALARAEVFTRDTGAGLVGFMYYLAIPALLFNSLANADLPATIPWTFLAAFYLPVIAVFLLSHRAAGPLLGWNAREAGIAGITATYANMVMLGFPLVVTAFGEKGAVPLFILLATQSLVMFPLTTYAIEAGTAREQLGGPSRHRALARLAFNPVIVSLMLGVLTNVMGWQITPIVARVFELLGAAGPGCALIALGISLAQYRLGGSYRAIIWFVPLKNFLCPCGVWLACHLSGVDELWSQVAVLLAAMPVGINAFIFASQYGLRQEEVAKTIVISTLVSAVVTSFLLARFIA